jgi:cytochrome c biogenesis protein
MKQKIFRLLADLRFSIFILLLISFCSIIGTIIEQDQSIETYKINYPLTNPVFGFLTWDRILQFGLDHVYKTWWFFALNFFIWIKFNFLYFFTTTSIFKNCSTMSIF